MAIKTPLFFFSVILISKIIVNSEASEPSATQLGWTEVTSTNSESSQSHTAFNSDSSSSKTSDFHSYVVETTSGSCNIKSSGINSDDMELLVKQHNVLRAKVANGEAKGQPSASNMNQIEWDDDLAKLAQDWAKECKFEHNKPTHEKFPYIGQNIHLSSTTDCKDSKKNLSEPEEMWFNEFKEPGYNVQYSSQEEGYPFIFSEGCGHYTQMIHANITHIGCGYVDYQTPSDCHNRLTVCNYGPGGNIEGEYIYKIGSPASKCTSKKPSTTFPGLCEPKK